MAPDRCKCTKTFYFNRKLFEDNSDNNLKGETSSSAVSLDSKPIKPQVCTCLYCRCTIAQRIEKKLPSHPKKCICRICKARVKESGCLSQLYKLKNISFSWLEWLLLPSKVGDDLVSKSRNTTLPFTQAQRLGIKHDNHKSQKPIKKQEDSKMKINLSATSHPSLTKEKLTNSKCCSCNAFQEKSVENVLNRLRAGCDKPSPEKLNETKLQVLQTKCNVSKIETDPNQKEFILNMTVVVAEDALTLPEKRPSLGMCEHPEACQCSTCTCSPQLPTPIQVPAEKPNKTKTKCTCGDACKCASKTKEHLKDCQCSTYKSKSARKIINPLLKRKKKCLCGPNCQCKHKHKTQDTYEDTYLTDDEPKRQPPTGCTCGTWPCPCVSKPNIEPPDMCEHPDECQCNPCKCKPTPQEPELPDMCEHSDNCECEICKCKYIPEKPKSPSDMCEHPDNCECEICKCKHKPEPPDMCEHPDNCQCEICKCKPIPKELELPDMCEHPDNCQCEICKCKPKPEEPEIPDMCEHPDNCQCETCTCKPRPKEPELPDMCEHPDNCECEICKCKPKPKEPKIPDMCEHPDNCQCETCKCKPKPKESELTDMCEHPDNCECEICKCKPKPKEPIVPEMCEHPGSCECEICICKPKPKPEIPDMCEHPDNCQCNPCKCKPKPELLPLEIAETSKEKEQTVIMCADPNNCQCETCMCTLNPRPSERSPATETQSVKEDALQGVMCEYPDNCQCETCKCTPIQEAEKSIPKSIVVCENPDDCQCDACKCTPIEERPKKHNSVRIEDVPKERCDDPNNCKCDTCNCTPLQGVLKLLEIVKEEETCAHPELCDCENCKFKSNDINAAETTVREAASDVTSVEETVEDTHNNTPPEKPDSHPLNCICETPEEETRQEQLPFPNMCEHPENCQCNACKCDPLSHNSEETPISVQECIEGELAKTSQEDSHTNDFKNSVKAGGSCGCSKMEVVAGEVPKEVNTASSKHCPCANCELKTPLLSEKGLQEILMKILCACDKVQQPRPLPHLLTCDCTECVCDFSEFIAKCPQSKQEVNELENCLNQIKCSCRTAEMQAQNGATATDDRQSEKLAEILEQVRCKCSEAEVEAMRSYCGQAFFPKKPASFENTMSLMEVALDALEKKCRTKDRMIATLTQELKMRANSKIFDELLFNIATDATCADVEDYTRSAICQSLPRPSAFLQCRKPGQSRRQSHQTGCGWPRSHPPVKQKPSCSCDNILHGALEQMCTNFKRPSSAPGAKPVRGSTNPGGCCCSAPINSAPLAFTDIRRIGPDSLLLKWKPPACKNISRYEITVNGVYKSTVRCGSQTSTVMDTLCLKGAVSLSIYALTAEGRCEPPANAVYHA